MIEPEESWPNSCRWLLEQDSDGEICTIDETTVQGISEALDTPYTGLMDTTDESCLWCFGEPDRRLIEICLVVGRVASHGVVATQSSNSSMTTLQAEDLRLDLPMEEVLTRQQAEQIFQEFFRSKSLPLGFRIVRKSYFFKA